MKRKIFKSKYGGYMRKILLLALSALLIVGTVGCEKSPSKITLDPKNPVVIQFATYYNDVHLAHIKQMVREFNEGIGADEGVYVEVVGSGSIAETNQMLLDSANDMPGSADFPDIFISYKGVVLEFKNKKPVVDFRKYFSQEELDQYLPNLLQIGCFEGEDGKISMLPMVSSTSIAFLNKTDFDLVAPEIGASEKDLTTYQDILKIAEKYYKYTDAMTDVPHDGLAFLGVDSPVGQVFSIYKAMGKDIVEYQDNIAKLNFDKDFAKLMWDTFYVPTLKGYITKNGRFSSEDFRTGKILLSCAPTSGASFHSNHVIDHHGEHEIEIKTLFNPEMKGHNTLSIHQGGGIFIAQSTEVREYASALFVKWITNKENNFDFSITTSYIPVRVDNTDLQLIQSELEKKEVDSKIASAIITSIRQTIERESYVPPSVIGYESVRTLVNDEFSITAQQQRNELLEKAQQGQDYDELLKEATSESSFEKWYVNLHQRLSDALL